MNEKSLPGRFTKYECADCTTVIEFLLEYLDSQLELSFTHELRSHIEGCSSCQRHERIELQLRELLRCACSCQAPVELQQSIVTKLTYLHIED